MVNRLDRLRRHLTEDWNSSPFTLPAIPLFMFRGGEVAKNVVGIGSGVAMRIGKRSFVFTAGRCIHDLKAPDISLRVSISRRSANYLPLETAPSNCHFTEGAEPDFGYLEVNAADAEEMAAHQVVFSSLKRAEIPSRMFGGDYSGQIVLVGYPGSLVDHGRQSFRQLSVPVDPAAVDALRELEGTQPEKAASIVFALSGIHLTGLGGEKKAKAVRSELASVSGGACWSAYEEAGGWRAALLGTFAGQQSDIVVAPLAWHLRMLIDAYPDLREEILATHPSVERYQTTA